MTEPLSNNEFWMTNLPERNQKWLLKNIAIPGSHNSFTFDLTDCNPVCKSSLEPFLQGICSLGFVQTIIFNWSVCQTLTVHDQLKLGIRYFDIRMACKPECGDLNCVHGLYCDCIKYYLNEIKKFLVTHPKEIVILDFNHFYDMQMDDFKRLCKEIKEMYGSLVLINFEANNIPGYTDIIWQRGTVNSIWPEKSSVNEVIGVLENHWNSTQKSTMFTVLQGVLTPTTNFVFMNLAGTLKTSLAHVGMCKTFSEWIVSRQALLDEQTLENRTQANIFLADFVESADFADNVIALNFAGKDC
ncbi:hypothetical protein HELRODRAFT_167516 [Helobdella robusta]|uniref:Phosphatidylinositol-specific phospholipase C X domain-containing protein n=1 Tax=Helobdella robusta TaxID=6412 RepID=T1EZG0_HELRO|nr:hypothetical protein HELRODRAFT_167516 [Helobdella robusta]ESO10998.1 hypothetical protein HELRODRAFT_167516 [Helobdella robusta]